MNETIKWALGICVSVVIAGVVYAMDWQRLQDEKLSDLDKLIEKQKVILEMQTQYQQQQQQQYQYQFPQQHQQQRGGY